MNTVTVVKNKTSSSKIEMGQIYQYGNAFYIVAKKGSDSTGCLINIENGNLWNNETPEQTISINTDFVLFRGTIQITTEY